MRSKLLLAMCLGLSWACSKTEAKQESGSGHGSVAPQAASAETAAPARQAQAKFTEEAFELEIVSPGAIQAQKPAELEVRLVAKPPYKCNDQYPYKLKLKPAPGVSFEESVVGIAKGKYTKEKVTLPVRFTAEGPGEKAIEGQFAFSVCTDERCLVERRDLKLAVRVE